MNGFFVATFAQVSNSESFKADKNGVLPFIGTVVAGTAIGSIINGSIFIRENKKAGQLYLCENFRDPEYPENVQTRIISEMSSVDLIKTRSELGQGQLIRTNSSQAAEAVEAVETVDESEIAE